ncbi:MAG: hypothetical protein ACHQET_01575 [Chitinophagales bacterium]
MKRSLFLTALLFIFYLSQSQINRELQNLRSHLKADGQAGIDSTSNQINYQPGGNLNYFYPLFQLFKQENKFRNLLSDNGYYDELSQAISFTEDYESSMQYQEKTYDSSVNEITKRQIAKVIRDLKNVQHVEARKYISFICRNFQVIMLNEAHNNPLHRAFTLSLLEDLFRKGYRYLALEMLNNFSNHQLDKLSPLTGHYCTEPVAGELIRVALQIGYQLISYEDTLATSHSASQRDSIQAANIYKVIQADPSAKILVHAGFGHIAENNMTMDYVPMAMAFKKISGIDPLTIDQTDMTEYSRFAFGKYFYDYYLEKFPITESSIALINDQPINPTNSALYDLAVIHPRTTYRDSRPTWLNLSGRRQSLYIKPPNKNVFFVQAYYQFESFGNKPAQVVPADQTYTPNNKGNYLLYLQKGKYIIVFRNMDYKIINTQHIEVN